MKESLLPYVLLYYKCAGQRNLDHPKLIVTDDILSRCRRSQRQILEADCGMFTVYIFIYTRTSIYITRIIKSLN